MKIARKFTIAGRDPFASVEWVKRSSKISNPDGSVVFQMDDAEVPASWSQLATDIMVSKYFRKAGVPQTDSAGKPILDKNGKPTTGPERSARQVIHRLAGCWRHWGERHGYFDSASDAQAFYDELAYMMVHQISAPNSPQWFNTGLSWAYGISGPAQGHWICDPKTGKVLAAPDAYSHPQPHACQPYDALISTPQGPIMIGDIVTKSLVGLEVFDGTGDGSGRTRVKAVKANGDKPVFRIVLKNGSAVEATADHLVLARPEGQPKAQWLRVDQILPGMRMLLSTRTTVEKASSERDEQEAFLAGWLQGDGFVGQYEHGTNRSLTVEFMTIDDDEHAAVMARIAAVFEGVHHHTRSVPSQSPDLDIKRIRMYGEPLRAFVDTYALLRHGDCELEVPPRIMTAGRGAQAAYLRALFQADGAVRLRERESRTADVVLTTVSHSLARGVQALLLNLGIYSRVQRGVEKRETRRTPYFVSIGYAESRRAFRDIVGFVSETKRAKLDAACSEAFPGKGLPPLREEAVLAIEAAGTMPVFDIQTESGQYLCGNIIIHNCFIQSVSDDLVNAGGIMDLWVREARLFKYGSGTGTNFSKLRAAGEHLSGGGKSSGLMSWLRIGDRAASAIKSGGTTRRAAKMVCLDMDHPDIGDFINWKVREEIKVQAMVEGLRAIAGSKASRNDPKSIGDAARELGLTLDYDFNGEAYQTVSGQNSNNSVRVPDAFFDTLDKNGDWETHWRTDGALARTYKASELWDAVAYAAWRCADPGVQFDTTINAWHTCPNAGRINASNPCVTGDTMVATADGLRRIDSMIGHAATIINGRGEPSFVDRIFPTGVKPVYELKTASGYRLRLTADHLVDTANRGDVPAGELTVDDRVRLVPQGFGTAFETRELAELVGAAMGDGCISHQPDQDFMFVSLGEPERAVADRLRAAIDDCKARYGSDGRSTRPTRVVDTATGVRVGTSVAAILARMEPYAILDEGADRKRFTDAAFGLDRPTQAAMLRALFTTDGTVADYGEKSQYVALDSTSLELLQQTQLMLLGFGIKSKLYENRRAIASTTTRLPDGKGGLAEYPVRQVHSLRISRSSRVVFEREIGFLPESSKAAKLAELNRRVGAYADHLVDRVASLTPAGVEPVYDLTEPSTRHFVANGIVVHNCSEYMFLDNTACNLASLNVLKFYDSTTRAFDVDRYEHAIDLWTIVLEVSVLMAAFPSKEIAELSYRYRTLGLGYANLGAMLMQAGLPYDSDEARAVGAALTAILTGRAYRQSALLARQHGAFAGYDADKENMLRVIRNHRRAAHGVARDASEYENLRIRPVPIDHAVLRSRTPAIRNATEILDHATRSWDDALTLGERHGFRNAQVTVIAPTGTIGLLMDCDTTGVEPDFALVKFKKLAGGGYFKIANASVAPALEALGYTARQSQDILTYILGTLSLDVPMPASVPGIRPGQTFALWLMDKGLSSEDVDRVAGSLPGVFEIGFAFGAWSIGDEALGRLGIDAASAKNDPKFNLLSKLGLRPDQIEQLNQLICGMQTIEGAPHLKPEHLPVFDCANTCGKTGTRFIAPDGHIRMMAAAQPFISGAISKTINLPANAAVADVQACYRMSWELGLKANALYRDGSKLSQPLSSSNAEASALAEPSPEEDGPLGEPADAAPPVAAAIEPKIERVVEVVHRPLRRRLPDTRRSITHKFNVASHEGYVTVGLYDDGKPGELFVTMAKEGSTIGGLMDSLGTATSVALQYGVPIESLVAKFTHQRFEPAGMTTNRDIPFAKSLVDYIFRWLGMQFVPGYHEANAPRRDGDTLVGESSRRPELAEPTRPVRFEREPVTVDSEGRVRTRANALDAANQEMMADAPACDVCGTITIRNGTCYKCVNCGNSMGCS